MCKKTQTYKDSSPQLFIYREWDKPVDSLTALVIEYVDKLNLEKVYDSYKGGGTSAYPPKAMLIGVLISYLNNKYSYRDMRDMFEYDMRVRWAAGGLRPSHMSLWRFLNQHLGNEVLSCFRQLLLHLMEAGLIDIGEMYIDGTTIESRASRYSIVWRKDVIRRAKDCTEKIEALLTMIKGEMVELPKDKDGVVTDGALSVLNKNLPGAGKKAAAAQGEKAASGQDGAAAQQPRAEAGGKKDAKEIEKAVKEAVEALSRLDGHKRDLAATGSGNSTPRAEQGENAAPGEDGAPAQQPGAEAGGKKDAKEIEKAAKEAAEALSRLDGHKRDLAAMGSGNSMSRTAPGAVGMRPKDDVRRTGPILAMHNMQIATSSHFILSASLFPTPSDAATFPEFFAETLGTYTMLRDHLTRTLLTRGICDDSGIRGLWTLLGAGLGFCVVADAGYGTNGNYRICDSVNADAYLKYTDYDHELQLSRRRASTAPKDGDFQFGRFPYDPATDTFMCPGRQKMTLDGHEPPEAGHPKGLARYVCDKCGDCPLLERCRKIGKFDENGRRVGQADIEWRDRKAAAKLLLDTERGQQLLKNRTLEPEPVFSHMKYDHNYSRMRHFDPERANIDLMLQCMARNIAKAAEMLQARKGGKPTGRTHPLHTPARAPLRADAEKTSKIRKFAQDATRRAKIPQIAAWWREAA